MRKWKIICNSTLSILIIFLIPILWWLFEAIWYDINGISYVIPGPTLTRWYDIFLFNSLWYLVIFIVPAIIDIILLVISIVKFKGSNLEEKI